MKASASESGFTFVELIFTITIIAIAMTGVVAVWSNAVSRSADPFWQAKTTLLAKQYFSQIQRQNFETLSAYQGYATGLHGESLLGYVGFKVKINVSLAGSDFSLAEEQIKKVDLLITTPLGKKQHFVTYRGRY
jgi:prepilin-type N-terminal cleavage/methylation domain-containing protein